SLPSGRGCHGQSRRESPAGARCRMQCAASPLGCQGAPPISMEADALPPQPFTKLYRWETRLKPGLRRLADIQCPSEGERRMTDQSTPDHQPGRRRRRWLPLTAIAVAAALTGAAATNAVGHGPWGSWGGWHGGSHGGWHGRWHGPLSPADIEDRIDRALRHLAIELDATPEQQEKLRTIARSAVKDLLPMRDKARAARARAAEILTQPTVDRTAIEAFRAGQIALADEASKRLAQAVGDAAEVLTPEQRQKVHEWVQWRRG